MLLIVVITSLLIACDNNDEHIIFPPKNNVELTFKASSLIYQNYGNTSYYIGGLDLIYIFKNDVLTIKDGDQTSTFPISYNKTTITAEDLEKQLKKEYSMLDISSYGNITQYNLCASTKDLPGYRLYVLEDQYWIGTLYGTQIWRIEGVFID